MRYKCAKFQLAIFTNKLSSVPWWNLANSKIKIVQERQKTVFLSYLWVSDQSFSWSVFLWYSLYDINFTFSVVFPIVA